MLQFGAEVTRLDGRPMQIVGVAPTIRHDLFDSAPEAHIYLPFGATDITRMFIYARVSAPSQIDAMTATMREELRAIDANLPVMRLASFKSQHERSAQVWILRAAARLFLTLGLAAAFVAVVGLYGVRSYLVTRRTREFGVRMAVGGRGSSRPQGSLDDDIRWPGDRPRPGCAAGLGAECRDLPGEPVRPDHAWWRRRNSRRLILYRVDGPGPTRCERAPHDCASQ